MLRASSLSKAIGGITLFRDLSFVVNPGECLGIVGPNGSGKSTLLRILAGEISPDGGSVFVTGGISPPMLRQGVDDLSGVASEQFPALFGASGAERQVEAVAARMASATSPAEQEQLAREYDQLLAAMVESPPPAESPLMPGIAPDTPIRVLSGGELERLAVLDLIAALPDILLLDEPTNHLDREALDALEERIRSFPGPVIVVSHDRAFLDAVATGILALGLEGNGHELFAGSYSAMADELERRRQRQLQEFRRQEREDRALKRAISAIESRARNVENRTIHFHYRKRAKKVARRATTLKARLEREQGSGERVERPAQDAIGLRAGLTDAPASASVLCQATNAELRAGDRTLLRDATFAVSRGDRVALVGANGAGKSTLLRAIQGLHPIAAGEVRVTGAAKLGVLEQDDGGSEFAGELADLTPVEWLRRDLELSPAAAANELHRFLGDHRVLQTPIRLLSYGERRRLALARIVLRGANLLLLDEPTNHLDLPAREAFERLLVGYDGAGIVATHDRYFIDRFATRVLAIEGGRLVEHT